MRVAKKYALQSFFSFLPCRTQVFAPTAGAIGRHAKDASIFKLSAPRGYGRLCKKGAQSMQGRG
ncbi:MAG: hypothetical protein DBX55_08565 [Verrucomicrobia bacterium]|nr:MAG: hypothetical protein DBX55_08565 [Verrucomicrobiota bacterium]